MKLTIGNNIRTLRRKADMTQEELAAQIGVSCQSVSRWEQGVDLPGYGASSGACRTVRRDRGYAAGYAGHRKGEESGRSVRRAAPRVYESRDRSRRGDPAHSGNPKQFYRLRRCSWRLSTAGNYRCYRHPEILPEVRLLAEAYKKRHSNDIHLVETMAYVEDEAHIDEFFEKYTLPYDASERALAFDRYYQLRDWERFEEERRYRFYQTISVLRTPNTLFDGEAEPAQIAAARAAFRAGSLRLICGGAGDRVDMWISDRLEIGLENARRLANAGNGAAALEQIESFVTLLEQTMAITDEQTLGSSCEWMEEACFGRPENFGRTNITIPTGRRNAPSMSIRRCPVSPPVISFSPAHFMKS